MRRAWALTAIAVAIAGCSAPTTGSTAAKGTTAMNVIVPDPGNFTSGMPVYVGIAQGFFKAQGISVNVVDTTGGATNVAAVSVLSADLHGAGLKILAADTTGMDILFFARAGSGITTLQDLSGKKVGYSSPGSSSEVALNAVNTILKSDGLSPATGEAIGGPPQEYTAVETGQIDAGFTAAPNLFSDVDNGSIKLLTSISTYPAYTDVAARVIFGSGSFISSNPSLVKGFLTAWQESWTYAFGHHAQAMADWKKGADLSESVSVLETGFDYYTATTQRLYPIDGLQRDISDAISLGVLKSALTSSQLNADMNTSFAQRVVGG
jgi:NitT/TauT family transport system substrate-binding protein